MVKHFAFILLIALTALGGALLKYNDEENLFASKLYEYVNVDIRDQVAITEVTAMFSMSETDTTFAQLQFPLPSTANIIKAEELVGDVWIACSLVAVVDSTDSGIGTGGVSGGSDVEEYLGERPFVLELIADTPEDVKVRFRYIQFLEYDKGSINYTYPSHSPDYFYEVCDSFYLACQIHSSRDIDSIGVSYVSAMESGTGHIRDLVYSDFAFLADEPLSIDFTVASDSLGLTALFYKQEPDTGYFLFIIEPPLDYDTSEVIPKDFVFVIDKSGSMGSARKMENAKLAAIDCIDNLNPMDRFNIVDYNGWVYSYNSEMLVHATEENIEDAVSYIDRLGSSGSTNIYGALMTALEFFDGELLPELIFLTDGLPSAGTFTDPADIRRLVRFENEEIGASIYSISLGSDADSLFLANLAFENSGTYLKVESDNIEEKVTELFSYLNYPVLRSPELVIEGVDVGDMYPMEVSAIFMGQQLIISGRYFESGTADISLRGIEHEPVEYDFSTLEFPEYTDSLSFIPIFWAKQYIDYWISWMSANGEEDSIVTKVTDIALKYGIVCRYTEFYHGGDDEEDPDTTGWESIAEVTDISLRAQPTTIGIRLNIALSHPEIVERVELLRSIDGGVFESMGDIDLALPIYDYPEKGQKVSYMIAVHYCYGAVDYSREVSLEYIVPGELYATSAYPNPFNSALRIDLTGEKDGTIAIFDINGNRVRSLRAESNFAIWDGCDDMGTELESGAYIIGSDSRPIKVMLLR